MLRVTVSNFKSVGNVKFEIAPLTILLGPPASGKSNILDAIALIGYFNKFLVLNKEYENKTANLEPLKELIRFTNHEHLFSYNDLTRRIFISIGRNNEKLNLSIQYVEGKISINVNNVNLLWDLITAPAQGFWNALNQVVKGKKLIEARLYGYDRFGLARTICTSHLSCGFHLHLKGTTYSRNTPKNIMSEFGWNAKEIAKSHRDIIIDLNNVMQKRVGEKVEVKVLRSGAVTIFDYDIEVEPSTVSDSIFRALYYLMALRSAMKYVKLYGLEKKFILLFEEPEAHVFPFFLDLLADDIKKATEVLYVVVTTHNPILVSILWDRVRETKTYYIHRDSKGLTKITEIHIEKLAEELKDAEDLLLMPSNEVLEKFGKT